MSNPVDVTAIADRWRELSSEEETVVEALLADAWAIVLNRYPSIEARIDAGTLSVGAVTAVISSMVLRVMRNPEGKRSEAIDDYSWTRDSSVAAGFLYLTPDELALLGPANSVMSAFTIKPANPYWTSTCGSDTRIPGHFR